MAVVSRLLVGLHQTIQTIMHFILFCIQLQCDVQQEVIKIDLKCSINANPDSNRMFFNRMSFSHSQMQQTHFYKHNLSHIQTFLSIGHKPRKSGRESDWFLTVVQSEEPKAFLFNYRVITDQ